MRECFESVSYDNSIVVGGWHCFYFTTKEPEATAFQEQDCLHYLMCKTSCACVRVC